MRIVFFGSDDFAAVHLERILAAGHEVVGCLTGPDKPQGRGMKLGLSPIKQLAAERQIACLQPLTLKSDGIVEALKAYQADLFVVVAYGRLLTQDVLDLPKIFCINVHGSLLPKYRGAAPVNWAILNGDTHTGVTVQKMALALDAGDILAQESMAIQENEHAAQLRQRMAGVGAQLLVKVLDKPQAFTLTPQDESQVTYAPKLTKDMGKVDWHKPARVISNQVRGLQPWPGAYTFYQGKMLKITQVQTVPETGRIAPGQVMAVSKAGISVAAGNQGILIKEVQPEAGKIMPAASFAAGYKIVLGSLLG